MIQVLSSFCLPSQSKTCQYTLFSMNLRNGSSQNHWKGEKINSSREQDQVIQENIIKEIKDRNKNYKSKKIEFENKKAKINKCLFLNIY